MSAAGVKGYVFGNDGAARTGLVSANQVERCWPLYIVGVPGGFDLTDAPVANQRYAVVYLGVGPGGGRFISETCPFAIDFISTWPNRMSVPEVAGGAFSWPALVEKIGNLPGGDGLLGLSVKRKVKK